MSSPASSSSSSSSSGATGSGGAGAGVPILHGGDADSECREYTLEVPLLSPTTGIDTLLHDAVNKQAVALRLQAFGQLLQCPLRRFRALIAVIIGLQKTGKSTLLRTVFDVPAKSGHLSDQATTLGADAFIRELMTVIDAEGSESVNRMNSARDLVRQQRQAMPSPPAEEEEEEETVESDALSHTRLYDRRLWAFTIAVSHVIIMVYRDLGLDFRQRMLMLQKVVKRLGTFHNSDNNGCGRPLLILVRNRCSLDDYLAEQRGLSNAQRGITALLTDRADPLFSRVEWRAIPEIPKTEANQDPFPACPGGITAAFVQTHGGAPDSSLHRALTAMLEVRSLAEEHMAQVWETLQHLPHGQLAVMFQAIPGLIEKLNGDQQLQSLLSAGLPIAERINEEARARLLDDFCNTAALTPEVAMDEATFNMQCAQIIQRFKNMCVRAPTVDQVEDQLMQQMRVEFDTKLRACDVECKSCGLVCQLGRIGHSGAEPHPPCPTPTTQPCALQCGRTVTRPCGLANGAAATRPDCGACCATADRLHPSSCALHLDTRCNLPHGHAGRHSNLDVCCCSTSSCIFQHTSAEGPLLPCMKRRGHEDPHTCEHCCSFQCAQHKTACTRPLGHLAQGQNHSCGQTTTAQSCADGCGNSVMLPCGDLHPGGCCCLQKCAQHNIKCTRGAADHGEDHRCPQCCTAVCAHGVKCIRGSGHLEPHSCGVSSLRPCTNQGCTGSTERMCGGSSPNHCCDNKCSVHPGAKCTVGFGHDGPHRCSQCCPGSCLEHGTLCTLAPGHAGNHVCGQSQSKPCPRGCGVNKFVACGAVHPTDCCCPHMCAHGRRCTVGVVGHAGVHRCPQCCSGVCAHGTPCILGSSHQSNGSGLMSHSCGVRETRACTNGCGVMLPNLVCGEQTASHCCPSRCGVHGDTKCIHGPNHGGRHECARRDARLPCMHRGCGQSTPSVLGCTPAARSRCGTAVSVIPIISWSCGIGSASSSVSSRRMTWLPPRASTISSKEGVRPRPCTVWA